MYSRTDILTTTDGSLHIYNRGVGRGTIFPGKGDYEHFLELLANHLDSREIHLLCYSLMPNHFHLAVWQKKEYAVSRLMEKVCGYYAKYYNKKRDRRGHLFEGRHQPRLIPDSEALLRVSHYIHWNPVSAGIAKSLAEWKYSSYKTFSLDGVEGLVMPEPLVSLVGGKEQYLRFLEEYDPARPDSLFKFLRKKRMTGGAA